MNPSNPFTNKNKIQKPEDFIGRHEEVKNILNHIQNRNSVSIRGDRRIGKSSLLYHIYQKGNEFLNSPKYHFVYLDCLDTRLRTLEGFAKRILKEIKIEYDKEEFKENPLFVFNDMLEAYAEEKKLVLLIDEFEALTKHQEVFNDDFMENLRFCGDAGLLTIITSSMHSLQNLASSKQLTSPFWNIFYNIILEEFTTTEATEFLVHYWGLKSELKANYKEMQFLVSYVSLHPLAMQIVSYHLLENREKHLSNAELLEIIGKDIAEILPSHQDKIWKWLKKKVPQIAQGIILTTEWIGKNISNLNPLKDLIHIKR